MNERSVYLILSALADPAFLLKDGQIACVNPAGQRLNLSDGDDCARLLPDAPLPEEGALLHWELSLGGVLWEATLQKLEQGHLLLLHRQTPEETAGSPLLLSAARGILSPLEELLAAGSRLFPQLEELEDESIQTGTAAISRAGFRLMRALSNLSSYDRLCREDTPLQLEKCDLTAFFRDLMGHAADVLLDCGVRLSYVGPDRAVYGAVDKQEVRRAVLHLLSNAAKFPGPDKTVTAQLTVLGKKLRLTVVNESAMDADVLATAFSRCHDPADSIPGQGAGLGLSIVRAVARHHGGSVLLETREGRTEATLTLDTGLAPASMNTPVTDYSYGYDPVLVELSCVLPASTFDSRSVDL